MFNSDGSCAYCGGGPGATPPGACCALRLADDRDDTRMLRHVLIRERDEARAEVERVTRQLIEERATQAALVEAIRQASATLAQWPSLVRRADG